MPKKRGDWVRLIEAGYNLDGNDSDWTQRIVECVAEEHWTHGNIGSFIFKLNQGQTHVHSLSTAGSNNIFDATQELMSNVTPEDMRLVILNPKVVFTISEAITGKASTAEALYDRIVKPLDEDTFGLVARDGRDGGVVLFRGLQKARAATSIERRRWSRCAAHLGAGLRLRRP